jgi:hypothetical protein
MGAPAPPIVGLIGPLHKKRAMLGVDCAEVKGARSLQPENGPEKGAPSCYILRRFLLGRLSTAAEKLAENRGPP